MSVSDLFKNKPFDECNRIFDDIRLVTHHLRHSCDNDNTIKKAIETISQKTDITKERVEEILLYMFKN